MNRSTTLLLIAVALLGYGIYAVSYVPGLLAPSAPALLIGFVLQAVCALAAAFGVWPESAVDWCRPGASWGEHCRNVAL